MLKVSLLIHEGFLSLKFLIPLSFFFFNSQSLCFFSLSDQSEFLSNLEEVSLDHTVLKVALVSSPKVVLHGLDVVH